MSWENILKRKYTYEEEQAMVREAARIIEEAFPDIDEVNLFRDFE